MVIPLKAVPKRNSKLVSSFNCSFPDAQISTWRPTLDCGILCPPFSKYSSQRSACPNTCADPKAEEHCEKGKIFQEKKTKAREKLFIALVISSCTHGFLGTTQIARDNAKRKIRREPLSQGCAWINYDYYVNMLIIWAPHTLMRTVSQISIIYISKSLFRNDGGLPLWGRICTGQYGDRQDEMHSYYAVWLYR